jgi:hypothetical protein
VFKLPSEPVMATPTVTRTGAGIPQTLFIRRNYQIRNALPILTKDLCFKNSKNRISPSEQLDVRTTKYILGQTFIFKNIGFFLLNNLNNVYRCPSPLKFKIKKKLFSFLAPNEVKNSLLRFKKAITLYNIVYKLNYIFSKGLNLSYQLNNLSNINRRLLRNSSITKLLFKTDAGHATTNKLTTTSRGVNTSYFSTSKTLDIVESLGRNNLDNSFKINEVRIPRIRFRPGYQRL